MVVFYSKSDPVLFLSDPRPQRGRYVWEPHDQGDPATQPTLPSTSGPTMSQYYEAEPMIIMMPIYLMRSRKQENCLHLY